MVCFCLLASEKIPSPLSALYTRWRCESLVPTSHLLEEDAALAAQFLRGTFGLGTFCGSVRQFDDPFPSALAVDAGRLDLVRQRQGAVLTLLRVHPFYCVAVDLRVADLLDPERDPLVVPVAHHDHVTDLDGGRDHLLLACHDTTSFHSTELT